MAESIPVQTDNSFKGNWRPAIGYICALALANKYIVTPLLPWIVSVCSGKPLIPIPEIDINSLYPLLGAVLGLGAFRSYEKVRGSD
jgi:hypothetical protein